MYAFSTSAPLVPTPAVTARQSAFTPALTPRSRSTVTGPTMAVRVGFARTAGKASTRFGGVARITEVADTYMAKSVLNQYMAMSQPTGVYSVQCAEGSTKGAAEAARVRVLNTKFRESQKGPSSKYFDMYEFRKQAINSDSLCSVEVKQFCSYSKMSKAYVIARAEAYGTCDRYATPESVEEAAMARYMDIAQKCAVNPSGVYNSSCVEGAAKDQAEDLRVAYLAAAYRNGQKPTGQLLKEKYEQRKFGYIQCHGCNYEEDIITKFPAVGASFRSKAYGY